MLVMRRRQGEAILIGDGVEIRILSIDGTRVKMGILAPRSVTVTAREIELVRKENLQAAETPNDASEAMARLLKALPNGGIAKTGEKTSEVADLGEKKA